MIALITSVWRLSLHGNDPLPQAYRGKNQNAGPPTMLATDSRPAKRDGQRFLLDSRFRSHGRTGSLKSLASYSFDDSICKLAA